MSPFSIENLSNNYSEKAVGLILPIQQVEFGVAITVEDQPDLLDIDGFYNAPGGGFWGAFKNSGPGGQNGELVGTIALINVGHDTGVIRKMFVKKEYRGKEFAIAQRLIEKLLEQAGTRGIKHLYLGTVDKMKAAHRFYERNGFIRIDPAALPAYFPRMAADNVFYHLTIHQ
jgi:putative acetyltransferase